MSGADRLDAEFRAGRLLRPSHDVLNVVDLANAMASLAGAEPASAPATGAQAVSQMIGETDHLIFVVADGLGMDLVDSLAVDGFMRRRLAARLQTTFPSTTAAAFTSLATGEWPNRHAAIGWYTYIPHVDAVTTIIPFVRTVDKTPLAQLGLTVDRAFPVPSRASGIDRPAMSILPQAIVDSVFSGYLSGSMPRTGYAALAEAVDAVAERVIEARGPTYTYLYVPSVDYAGHELGFRDAGTLAVAAALEQALDSLAQRLSGRARIVVTADHGGLDAGPARIHMLRPSDPLVRMLRREPSGDSRVACFHVREGEDARFRETFIDRFGDRFFLITVDEAEDLSLFGPGPLSGETRRRLGSFIAVSSAADVLLYEWPSRAAEDKLFVGYHSGLTPAEMLVPLILA